MNFLFGVLFSQLLILLTGPGDISKINSLKSEAKEAYVKGDYKTAIEKYKSLVETHGVKEDEVMLNLANSYFSIQDTTNAPSSYLPLTQSSNSKIKSIANQQLGVMANRNGKFEEALNYFKQALKTAPDNEDARYNYEMVKKKLEEQKKQEQQNKDQNKENKDDKKEQNKDKKDQQNKDQQDKKDKEQNKDKQDQQNKEQKSKEQKEKEKKEKEQQEKEQQEKNEQNKEKLPPSVSDKLKQMQMSEEKAKMILEAMKNQEVQYLQQNKRKASKPRDKGKPDW